jgi:hypothetical protein
MVGSRQERNTPSIVDTVTVPVTRPCRSAMRARASSIHLAQRAAQVLADDAAFGGEHHAIGTALEQRRAELALQALDGIKAKVGKVPNLYAIFANSPLVLSAHLALNGALGAGRPSTTQREATARRRVGFMVGN